MVASRRWGVGRSGFAAKRSSAAARDFFGEVVDDGGAAGGADAPLSADAADALFAASPLLTRHVVTYSGMVVLSHPEPLPEAEATKDRSSEIAKTTDFELSRADKVTRTYTQHGFAKAPVPPTVWASIATYAAGCATRLPLPAGAPAPLRAARASRAALSSRRVLRSLAAVTAAVAVG